MRLNVRYSVHIIAFGFLGKRIKMDSFMLVGITHSLVVGFSSYKSTTHVLQTTPSVTLTISALSSLNANWSPGNTRRRIAVSTVKYKEFIREGGCRVRMEHRN